MLDNIFQALSVLRPLLGDSIALFTIAVGVAFGVVTLAVLYLLGRSVSPTRRRLAEGGFAHTYTDKSRTARKIDKAVKPIRGLIVPTKEKDLNATQKRLIHAGYRSEEAITVFYAVKVLMILVFAMIAGVIAVVFVKASSETILYSMLFGALLGVVAPSYYLDKKMDKRKTEIINAFPDVLDLMVACSEAGLGLNAAIQRVARETQMMYPILSAELELVNSEIRSGIDRVDALRGLSDRTGIEEISGFVSMISQSVKFGTSIAETLRIYSEEFRDKRMQRAEEKAAKVSTYLIFPLVLCIFPSFFCIAIGPSVILIMRAFSGVG